MLGCLHGVHGDLQVAVGAVLEADREGEAAGHLAVGLGFGGAGADGAPADHVGHIFRCDRIEHLVGHRHLQFGQPEKQAPGDPQPLRDQVGAVHVGIVDQPFPADGGARFFEVDPHHQHELVIHAPGQGRQAAGIVDGGLGVMDRAGADHDHQAAVTALDYLLELLPAGVDEFGMGRGKREDLAQVGTVRLWE